MENQESLLASNTGTVPPGVAARTNWMRGYLDYNGANTSNWDPNQDLVISPLWTLVGQAPAIFKCPADTSVVRYSNQLYPRVRSYSMNNTFGYPVWLDNLSNTNFRRYSLSGHIVRPARTFVFIGEHPMGIDDGDFVVQCSGGEPGDPPGLAQIGSYPASYHNNSANLSFADGHVETRRWIGSTIRPPLTEPIPITRAAGNSWMDVKWLVANTSVRW